jgi:homoprotocatechuate degradation regulator HpaR
MTDKPLRSYDRSLPIALLRAREATMRLFKPQVDAAGLTLPQWRVIRALAEDGEHDASDLAEQCAVLPPSMSRILATLEAKGLLARGREDADGRRLSITLTESGRKIFDEIAPHSEQSYRELETAFGEERLGSLLNELSELREVAASLKRADR